MKLIEIFETYWELLIFFENVWLSRLFDGFNAQSSQQIEKSLPKYVENWLFVYSNKRKTVNTHLNFQVWTSWLISIKIFGSWKLIKRKLRFLNLNQHWSTVETGFLKTSRNFLYCQNWLKKLLILRARQNKSRPPGLKKH